MPVAAEVLKQVNDSNFNFDEDTLEEAVDKLNEITRDQIINVFKAVGQDQALELPVNYTYQKTGDVKKQTLKDIISSQVQGEFNLKTKSINGESKLIVENNGTEYELDTETWTLKGNQVQASSNRLEQLTDFNGKEMKISQALNTILNDKDIRPKILSNMIFGDENTLNKFIKDFNDLAYNITDDEKIAEGLKEMKGQYPEIALYIKDNYPDIYKIFEC